MSNRLERAIIKLRTMSCKEYKSLIYRQISAVDMNTSSQELYPVQPKDSLPELIVCAANKDPDTGVVYPCVRHGCEIFWGLIDSQYPHGTKKVIHFEQGFLTNKYRFVGREEAWDIAIQQKQIRRSLPCDHLKELFSEHLY